MDGSVDNDLPMTRLSEMFNVNHFIVSQVNPHVVPFLDGENRKSGRSGVQSPDQTVADTSGLWTTLGGIAKSELLHRMQLLTEFGVLPTTLTKFRSVMSQKYSGDITILPRISFSMAPRVLQNPDPAFMEEALISGDRATWPKLSRIRNHLAIELAIDEAIQRLMRKMAFSPSQVNLRMMSLTSSKHAETDRARQARIFNHSRAKTQSWCVEPNPTHLSQLTPQFQIHPRHEMQDKLKTTTVHFIPKRTSDSEHSGSDSDEEDNADGFLLNLSSRSRRKRPLESSPEPAAYDSSTSNIRSHSPSPTGSPDPVTAYAPPPVLWPVSGRMGPVSQPVTPFGWRNRRRSSPEMLTPGASAGLTMTSSAQEKPSMNEFSVPMSEAERKYKKIFHRDGNTHSVPVSAGGAPVDISGTRAMLLRRKSSRGSNVDKYV
jgi:TAG lipase/steryl ester hydrolase/phospholipase A2/LPA acyltransferase